MTPTSVTISTTPGRCVMLLKSPELDVKMISTTCYNSHARARLVAKLLTVAGRTEIPIALGPGENGKTRQDEWCQDFQLDQYAGTVYDDGPQAVIDLVRKSQPPITIIAVGPLQSLSRALEKDPSIASRAHFIGMHGSVYKGYGGSSEVSAEYNVQRDAMAARRVLSAPWKSTMITPLDTCGLVDLEQDRFKMLKQSDDPLVKALLENYQIWAQKNIGRRTHSQQYAVRHRGGLPGLPRSQRADPAENALNPRHGRRLHAHRSAREGNGGRHVLERPGQLPRPAGEGPDRSPTTTLIHNPAVPRELRRTE